MNRNNKNRSQRWRKEEIKKGFHQARRFRALMHYNTRNGGVFYYFNPESNYPD